MFEWNKRGNTLYYQNKEGTILGWVVKTEEGYLAERNNTETQLFPHIDDAKGYVQQGLRKKDNKYLYANTK